MRWQRALVTGASSGIGAAFARRLAGQGASVVAVARREERLRDLPGDVEVLAADLTDPDGVAAVEHRIGKGDIDLLVNNAGFTSMGPVVDIAAGKVADEVALLVVAVTRLTRAALPPMLERGRGGILNVSSVVGFYPSAQMATYAGAKAFVNSFTESVAEEVRGSGVQVAVLCPGLTRTEFHGVAGMGELRNLPSFAWMDADAVASAGLDGLARGRTVIVPGAVNKALVATLKVTPRSFTRRAVGIVQRLRS